MSDKLIKITFPDGRIAEYASGITGEITYVDAGFNISAMPLKETFDD